MLPRILWQKHSWRGAPSATQTKSGSVRLMRPASSASYKGVISLNTEGSAPQMSMPG